MPGTVLNAEETMLAKNIQYTPCSHGIYQLIRGTEKLWIRLNGGGTYRLLWGQKSGYLIQSSLVRSTKGCLSEPEGSKGVN